MTKSHHLFTFLLLAGALFCYAFALPTGATLLMICGLFLEVAFWLRLSRQRRRSASDRKPENP